MTPAMSMTQAAQALGLNRSKLKQLTDDGVIPCWYVSDSGRYVYSATTIAEHQRSAAHRTDRPVKREAS